MRHDDGELGFFFYPAVPCWKETRQGTKMKMVQCIGPAGKAVHLSVCSDSSPKCSISASKRRRMERAQRLADGGVCNGGRCK